MHHTLPSGRINLADRLRDSSRATPAPMATILSRVRNAEPA